MTSPAHEDDRGHRRVVPADGAPASNIPSGTTGDIPVEPPTTPVPAQPAQTTRPADSPVKRTRISGTWIAIIVATILLIFLLIFILQNLATVTVAFLGLAGNLPLGVALLFAAISGALLVALVGAARITQIRRRVHRAKH
jgi:uncharacterized integral membrane protein